MIQLNVFVSFNKPELSARRNDVNTDDTWPSLVQITELSTTHINNITQRIILVYQFIIISHTNECCLLRRYESTKKTLFNPKCRFWSEKLITLTFWKVTWYTINKSEGLWLK